VTSDVGSAESSVGHGDGSAGAGAGFETGVLPADSVRRMFDRIAPVYDVMNRVMTAGLDRRWRRIAVAETVRRGDRVLDACCGTGDLAIAARRAGATVVGVDFSTPMLERARRKEPAIEWVRGDVLALPFADGSFEAAVVGFGVRNIDDLDAGLRELRRVLRPRGRLGLPASVRRFPAPEQFARRLEEAGFAVLRIRLFAGGIVALHVGEAR
jgi:demethylmenaquinone methyltransferase/2-methoxy-6-polyprenyl-1,4-benzoquinol methylase